MHIFLLPTVLQISFVKYEMISGRCELFEEGAWATPEYDAPGSKLTGIVKSLPSDGLTFEAPYLIRTKPLTAGRSCGVLSYMQCLGLDKPSLDCHLPVEK